MKKLLALLLCCALLIPFGVFSAAAETADMPFELVAPGNVAALWLEGGDSPTTTRIVYSLSNEMTDYFKRYELASVEDTQEEFFSQYSFDGIILSTQIDWAVDDVEDPVSGWHCNEYWDYNREFGFGHDDSGMLRTGAWDEVDFGLNNGTETVQSDWITRGMVKWYFDGDPENGWPCLGDQMNPDQYTATYDEEEDEFQLTIDYDQHTVYFRMRFTLRIYKNDEVVDCLYSEWSNVAAVGKNGPHYRFPTEEELKAPVITGLRMMDELHDFNGFPTVAFTLTVPEELAEMVAAATVLDGRISIEVQGRPIGQENWIVLQGDWIVKAGEMEAALQNMGEAYESDVAVDRDVAMELRCRYWCDTRDDEFTSPWSAPITFDNRVEGTWGDVDGDGKVTSTDARLVLQLSVNKIRETALKNPAVADVDGDGKVSSTDARLILQYSVKKIDQFPVEDKA